MSTAFLASLAVVVAAVLCARFILPGSPLRRIAVPITGPDVALTTVGLSGLALHCGAMFFPALVEAVPGADGAVRQINALGTASVIGYAVPAALVLVGLRRHHRAALAAVLLSLLAVGVTMYDSGPLPAHLSAIFALVVVLAAVMALVVLPHGHPHPLPGQQ